MPISGVLKQLNLGFAAVLQQENGNLGPKTSEFGKSERTLVWQYKALPYVR